MKNVLVLVAIAFSTACLPAAPIVPVTAANTQQVSACQQIASVHNGVVLGDFVLGGSATTLAGVGAMATNTSVKTDLSIAAAVVGGVSLAGTAIAGYTAGDFANSNCSSVLGQLPTVSADATKK
jgi:hypothetical protein